jgi:hypothetical protein
MDNPERSEAEPKATFVFKGTVKKLKAATMKSVPADERNAVVHVEQVLEAPKNLALYAGKDVTVQLAARPPVAAGQEFVFHTVGWIFGDSVAVRALSQEPVRESHAAMLARGGDPAEHRARRELQERVDAADLVVSGRVVAVRLPGSGEAAPRAALASAPPPAKPHSEHDPKWREAVVEIDGVHKGQHAGEHVTVLFPSSIDVRWYKAPKFQAGNQGTFVLHKAKMKESDRVDAPARARLEAAAGEQQVQVYTALHEADFQPSTHQERVRGVLAGSDRTGGR